MPLPLSKRYAAAFGKGVSGELAGRVVEALSILCGAAYLLIRAHFSWNKLLEGRGEAFTVGIWVVAALIIWHAFRSAFVVSQEIKKEHPTESKILSPEGRPLEEKPLDLYPQRKLYGTALTLSCIFILIAILVTAKYRGPLPPPEEQAIPAVIFGYGPKAVPGGVPVNPLNISGMHTVVASTEKASLYLQRNYIVLMMRGTDNTIDFQGDSGIQVSPAFRIPQTSAEIEIPFSELTARRLVNSLRIELYLAMLPDGEPLSEIHTINDVLQHRGRFLDSKNWTLTKVARVPPPQTKQPRSNKPENNPNDGRPEEQFEFPTPLTVGANPNPSATTPRQPAKLDFKESVYLTSPRRKRIERTLLSFRDYLISLGLSLPPGVPPIEVSTDPHHLYGSTTMIDAPTRWNTLAIHKDLLDKPETIAKSYAHYVFWHLLGMKPSERLQQLRQQTANTTNWIELQKIWQTIDKDPETREQQFRWMVASEFAIYFPCSYSGKRDASGELGSSMGDPLWAIRQATSPAFADRLAVYTLMAILDRQVQVYSATYRLAFYEQIKRADAALDSESSKMPLIDAALRNFGWMDWREWGTTPLRVAVCDSVLIRSLCAALRFPFQFQNRAYDGRNLGARCPTAGLGQRWVPAFFPCFSCPTVV